MRGFLIDVVNQDFKVVDVKSDIHEWYKLLNCTMIEMPERRIGGKYYTIICDEEGLLKENPIVSAINDSCEVMLVGSLLIFDFDEKEGDVADLTTADIERIMLNVRKVAVMNKVTGEIRPQIMLTGVEY